VNLGKTCGSQANFQTRKNVVPASPKGDSRRGQTWASIVGPGEEGEELGRRRAPHGKRVNTRPKSDSWSLEASVGQTHNLTLFGQGTVQYVKERGRVCCPVGDAGRPGGLIVSG
jgi:hypothetical protein